MQSWEQHGILHGTLFQEPEEGMESMLVTLFQVQLLVKCGEGPEERRCSLRRSRKQTVKEEEDSMHWDGGGRCHVQRPREWATGWGHRWASEHCRGRQWEVEGAGSRPGTGFLGGEKALWSGFLFPLTSVDLGVLISPQVFSLPSVGIFSIKLVHDRKMPDMVPMCLWLTCKAGTHHLFLQVVKVSLRECVWI